MGKAPPRAGASPLRASTMLALVVCAALVTAGALLFVWQRYQFVRLGFEVSELRREETRLRKAIEPLEVEAEYLSRPERIEHLARERLGLRPPKPAQIVVLEEREADPTQPQ